MKCCKSKQIICVIQLESTKKKVCFELLMKEILSFKFKSHLFKEK